MTLIDIYSMKVVCYKKNSEHKNCIPTLTPPPHMSCKNICMDMVHVRMKIYFIS